jgi:DNA repair protein RadC
MSVKPTADLPLANRLPHGGPQIPHRVTTETINLADHEVLQLVLTPVASSQSAGLIAKALLEEFGTFGRVIHAAATDLMAVDGLEEAGVLALKTVGAAALHMLRKAIDDAPRIRMWDDLIRYVIARLQYERVEVFFCIFLDSASRVIADEELSRGAINRVAVYPREIMRRCEELAATEIILVHNHPTGILEPSPEDLAFTQAVVGAATIMGIKVHDHIIVACGEHFSFRAQKLLF